MRFGVVLDLDGTLVDSVYHHVLAWDRALTTHGHHVPLHRIHAGIGIGSSRLVTWLLGGVPDEMEAITDEHERLFLEQQDRLRPTRGARELIDDLDRRGVSYVVATSAGSSVRKALLDALDRSGMPLTDADAVDAPKPAEDLLVAACQQIDVEPPHAVMIGDSPWDVAAARRVGMQMISVRTGGFGDAALAARGPTAIVNAPGDLIATL